MTTTTNAGRSIENIVTRARIARMTGRWPDWRWHSLPNGIPNARGWAAEFTRIAENGVFSVMVRDVDTAWGKVRHAMIATPAAGGEPTWSERQRIKNELLGREKTAIEVFPAMGDLVDAADAYHLWVLPQGMALPFTLKSSPSPVAGGEAPCAAESDAAGAASNANSEDTI